MQRLEARVAHSGQLLGALSYRGVLARGFALVRDEQGSPLHAAASVGPGARLNLEFADGRGRRDRRCGSAGGDEQRRRKPAASEPKTAEKTGGAQDCAQARRQAGRAKEACFRR